MFLYVNEHTEMLVRAEHTCRLGTYRWLVRKTRPNFARWGYPETYRSDSGPCYASIEWQDLMDEGPVKRVTSNLYHRQSNGLEERAVQTVKNMWRKGADRNSALLAYRKTSPLTAATGQMSS